MTNPSIADQLRMHNPVPCYIGHSHVFCSRHYVIYEILARYLWLARRSDAAISVLDSITHVDVRHCSTISVELVSLGVQRSALRACLVGTLASVHLGDPLDARL